MNVFHYYGQGNPTFETKVMKTLIIRFFSLVCFIYIVIVTYHYLSRIRIKVSLASTNEQAVEDKDFEEDGDIEVSDEDVLIDVEELLDDTESESKEDDQEEEAIPDEESDDYFENNFFSVDGECVKLKVSCEPLFLELIKSSLETN